MATSRELIAGLQQRLEDRANLRTKTWWESYLKYTITFRGVKMSDVRAARLKLLHRSSARRSR